MCLIMVLHYMMITLEQNMHNARDYTISREKNPPFAADTHLHIGLPLLSFVMSPIP